MASCNLQYSGSTGVIQAAAHVTEVTVSGSERRVRLRLGVWAVDFSGNRDASYSVRCAQSGTDTSIAMYNGFTINGSEQYIFDETFTVSVPSGSSTAQISLSFTASLMSPSAGLKSVSGTVTTLTLTKNSEEEPEAEPSELILSAVSASMGDTVYISVDRSSTGLWHKLYYQADNGGWNLIADRVATYYPWTVPDVTEDYSGGMEIEVRVYCETYTAAGSYVGQTSADLTVTLPAVTVPVCGETGVMGSGLAISLPRSFSGYTHDLSYSFAGKTGQIVSGAGDGCTWAVPLSLAKEIPSKTEALCTLTCKTVLNGTTVGSRTLGVTLQVPEDDRTKPEAAMLLTPDSRLGEKFAGLYIRGRTGVKASFTASSTYSQISSYALSVDGVTVTGNPAVSAFLNGYGEVTVTGTVTDARGFSRVLTQTVDVIYYDKPRVIPYAGESTVLALRCDYPDGKRNPKGQSLLLRAGRKYTPLILEEEQTNRCTLRWRYKSSGQEEYSDFVTLIPGEDTAEDQISLVVENAVPELKTGYTVQIEASDTLGGSSVITLPVAALSIPFHIGRGSGNVAVGKYCDYSHGSAFEIGLPTYFATGIAPREIFSGAQWAAGTELNTAAASAEGSALGLYTLFLGVCAGEPVLLMRLDEGIWGNGVKIRIADSVITLETAAAPLTALYALV